MGNDRITVYQFKNKKAQELFKRLTTETCEFTNCFTDLEDHMKKQHPNLTLTQPASRSRTCEVCDVWFENENELKTHIESNHIKGTAVKCNKFNFTSENENHLELHIKIYHMNRIANKCDMCNINFEPSFDEQSTRWKEILERYFRKCFKKVRITNKSKGKTKETNILMEKRREFKRKPVLNEEEEEKLKELEDIIAKKCEEMNKKKIVDNFKELESQGDINNQGIWKIKNKYFPKIKPTLPTGKRNIKQQIIANPEEIKKLYLETFKFRLRQRPVQPGFENILIEQKELFDLRLELAKGEKHSLGSWRTWRTL